ncbi:MAG: hypothetical protein WC697_00175 [Patescibacteria group bacterium]|jgi:hypothetical protein
MVKKKILIIIAIVVIIILIFGLTLFLKNYRKIDQTVEKEKPALVPTIPAEKTPGTENQKLINSPLGEFNPENPEKTAPLAPEKVAEVVNKTGVIEITISPAGISPSEFTVAAGKTVSLVIKAVRDSYVFKFKDSELANFRAGVSIDETRGISFIAPEKKGDYIFVRERPGFEDELNPAAGVMHVK